ncbi:hypothetical protein RB195_021977 [Necator americanus]|uniref:Uncharacterized protein n=1 Tax=Necator americanus TaxID=51031 RepID=A0ABR1EDG4_NECAM
MILENKHQSDISDMQFEQLHNSSSTMKSCQICNGRVERTTAKLQGMSLVGFKICANYRIHHTNTTIYSSSLTHYHLRVEDSIMLRINPVFVPLFIFSDAVDT